MKKIYLLLLLFISGFCLAQIKTLKEIQALYYKSPQEIHRALVNKGYKLTENDDGDGEILRFYKLKTENFVYEVTIDKPIDLTYEVEFKLKGQDQLDHIMKELVQQKYSGFTSGKIILYDKGKKAVDIFMEDDGSFRITYSDELLKTNKNTK